MFGYGNGSSPRSRSVPDASIVDTTGHRLRAGDGRKINGERKG